MSPPLPRLLPPRQELRRCILRSAPELACLALLDDALGATADSLSAVHPTLLCPTEPHEPPSLSTARRLRSVIADLRAVLHRYRDAVYDAIGVDPDSVDDELF